VRRTPYIVAAVGGFALVVSGLWAMVGPRSFFDAVATFPPYNVHLLRDIGAFLVGLGIALLAGLRFRHALVAVLFANATGAVLHAVSHIVDRDRGGRAADPVVFVVIAVVLVVATVQAAKEEPS
jgi:uncharacterized protein YjeT (DUF2065 family)